jgi:predicted neuraminidase
LAHTVWIGLALAVAIKIVVDPVRHSVFPKFAAGAQHWWAGQPLYADYPDLGPFRYSPLFAVAMTPFSLLGHRVGAVLWVFTGIALFLFGLRGIVRHVLPERATSGHEAALIILTVFPAVRGVWNAQANIHVIAFLMLGCMCIAQARWWRAACCLAIPAFMKLSPLAVVMLLAAIYPRRLAGRLAAVLAVGLLVPFFFQSPGYVSGQYAAWLQHLAQTSDVRWPGFRDAWTAWELVDAPINLTGYRIIQVTTAFAVLAWCLWIGARSPNDRVKLTLALSMGLCWVLLFGPAVEYNTYVLLGPVIVWALLGGLVTRQAPALPVVAYILVTFIGAGGVERALLGVSHLFSAALPVGTSLFVLWLIWNGPVVARETVPREFAGAKPVEGGVTRLAKCLRASCFQLLLGLAGCQESPPCTSGSTPARSAVDARSLSEPAFINYAPLPTDSARYPYNHAATIAEAQSGDLLVAWAAGSAEAARDTVIVLSRRARGEEAWSHPVVVSDASEAGAANPTLFVDDRGTIWLFHVRLLVEGSLCLSHVVVKTSGDAGATWSASRRAFHPPCTLVKNKPIITQGGAWIFPAYQQAFYQSQFLFSADRGETWSALSPLLTLPDSNLQPAIVQLSDGSLFALMRNGSGGGFTWEGRSTNCGRSWNFRERRDLPNPNSGIDLIALEDGRLLHAYNPDSRERTPIAVAVSMDDGQSWSPPKNIETGPPQLSYPSMIQAADGVIHMVYSHRLGFIQHVAFNAAWLSEAPDDVSVGD